MDELILVAIAFLFFAFFHSFTAHEVFKKKLSSVTSEFFVEHFWRLPYCIISFALLNFTIILPLSSAEFIRPLVAYPLWFYNILAIFYVFGLVIIYWAFIQVDYFEFWGFKQAYRGLKSMITKKPPQKLDIAGVDRLEIKGVYNVVRHPMLAGGFLIVLCSPPTISTLFYAAMIFIYMVTGVHYEEKRLHANIGPQYAEYSRKVGAFFPKLTQFRSVLMFIFRNTFGRILLLKKA